MSTVEQVDETMFCPPVPKIENKIWPAPVTDSERIWITTEDGHIFGLHPAVLDPEYPMVHTEIFENTFGSIENVPRGTITTKEDMFQLPYWVEPASAEFWVNYVENLVTEPCPNLMKIFDGITSYDQQGRVYGIDISNILEPRDFMNPMEKKIYEALITPSTRDKTTRQLAKYLLLLDNVYTQSARPQEFITIILYFNEQNPTLALRIQEILSEEGAYGIYQNEVEFLTMRDKVKEVLSIIIDLMKVSDEFEEEEKLNNIEEPIVNIYKMVCEDYDKAYQEVCSMFKNNTIRDFMSDLLKNAAAPDPLPENFSE